MASRKSGGEPGAATVNLRQYQVVADVIPLKRSAALDDEGGELLDELDALRVSGLASFDAGDVPHVVQLVRDIDPGHGTADVTVADIRRLLGRAIGSLDNNKMLSPAAALFALREDDDLGAELPDRMVAAAHCHKSGMSVRGYSGSPPKGRKTADLRKVRDALLTMLRDVQRPGAREPQRSAVLAGWLLPGDPVV